jgi:hypothetical protein
MALALLLSKPRTCPQSPPLPGTPTPESATRTHPYQRSTAKRRAIQRLPRPRDSVSGAGMGSIMMALLRPDGYRSSTRSAQEYPGNPPGPWRRWVRRAPPLANLMCLLRLGEAPRWALNQPDELLDPEAGLAFRPTRGGLRRARALPHRLARDEGAGAVSPTVGSRSPAPWPARPGPWPASVGRPAGVGRRSRPWPHRLAAESRTGPRAAAAQRPLGRRAPPGP